MSALRERHGRRVAGEKVSPRRARSAPATSLPCGYLGAATGETVPCASCGGTVSLKVLACEIHGACTPTKKVAGVKCCVGCNDRPVTPPNLQVERHKFQVPPSSGRPPNGFEWVSTARLIRDSITLAARLPHDTAGIVGIPRSGMLPASLIATHLHLPLYELTPQGPRRLASGSRGGTLPRVGRLVVVDDTVYGGGAMALARQAMRGTTAVFAAVYVRPESRIAVDLFARDLHSPHLLEWNFANNGPMRGSSRNPVYGTGLAWDIDGIIVHDSESGGPVGQPYLVPRAHACRLIVTGRRERHRAVTEAMLKGLGVRWERLEMYADAEPWGNEERHAEHKAASYAASGCGFFVESCPIQAELIHKATGKPVICPRAERVFQ